MGPTSLDPLGHARIIIDGCLKRDYCQANGIDSATHFSEMRHEFARYRDGFQSDATIDVLSSGKNEAANAPSHLSIVGCVAFLVSLVLSCLAVFLCYVWGH